MKSFLFLVYILFATQSFLYAAELATGSSKVRNIYIEGIKKTKSHTILRELTFSKGDTIASTDILQSVQNLKNMNMFSEVHPLLKLHEHNEISITFKLSEKWTTIPFFNFTSGGNTRYIKTGLYDSNIFGKYVEAGAQYENLNDEHSGLLWYRNPRLYDQRLLLGLDIGNRKRPRQLYSTSGEKLYRYGISDDIFEAFIEKEFRQWFKAGIAVHYRKQKFTNIDSTDTPPQQFSQQLLSGDTNQFTAIKLYTRLGNINYDVYLLQGYEALVLVEENMEKDSDEAFRRYHFNLKGFHLLPYKANLALNFQSQTINTHDLHQLFFIGGLDKIRGYFDGQFVGSSYWRGNVEYRIPSMDNKLMVIQHIFFFDIAQIKQRFSDLNFNGSDTYSSIGFGVRFISPRIYSFNGRIDIAFPSKESGASLISIGVQQFF